MLPTQPLKPRSSPRVYLYQHSPGHSTTYREAPESTPDLLEPVPRVCDRQLYGMIVDSKHRGKNPPPVPSPFHQPCLWFGRYDCTHLTGRETGLLKAGTSQPLVAEPGRIAAGAFAKSFCVLPSLPTQKTRKDRHVVGGKWNKNLRVGWSREPEFVSLPHDKPHPLQPGSRTVPRQNSRLQHTEN